MASEGGGHNIAAGAESWGDGYMPPPGMTVYAGYLLWLHAMSVRDNAGNSTVPEFRADLVAHAGRFLHTWEPTWHGVSLSFGFTYIVDYAKVKTGASRDENVDLDDLNLEPAYFAGAIGDLHWMTGPNLWWGMGKYNPNDPANAATHYGHYLTYFWDTGLTWQPSPRFEMSLDTAQGANTRNPRTQYRSGALTNIDIGATGQPFARIPLGIGWTAFWLEQLSDDRADGVQLPGTRIHQFSTGPMITYTVTPTIAFLLKYQHDLHTVNTAKGNRVWFEWTMPLAFSHRHPGSAGPPGASCCAPGPPIQVPLGP